LAYGIYKLARYLLGDGIYRSISIPMKIPSHLTALCAFLLINLSLTAQNSHKPRMSGEITGPQKVLKGEIVKKSWSKSPQSYCAGGSDYFILKSEEGELVLKLTARQVEKLDVQKRRKKKYKGILITRELPALNYDQVPVNGYSQGKQLGCFICHVFEVKNL